MAAVENMSALVNKKNKLGK